MDRTREASQTPPRNRNPFSRSYLKLHLKYFLVDFVSEAGLYNRTKDLEDGKALALAASTVPDKKFVLSG